MMYTRDRSKNGAIWKKLAFDIDIVPQRENPLSRETTNNTILSIWNNGMFLPENSENAILALKNMTSQATPLFLSTALKRALRYCHK